MNSPTHRFGRKPAGVALLAALVGLAAAGPGIARSLEDELLDNKFRHGDYAVYAGWHEPDGEQFYEHASAAYPFGAKVRLRWGSWARVEADASYYRRTGQVRPWDIVNVPGFDGLMVAASLQATSGSWHGLRPYAGGGPVFVSLTNELAVIIREIEEVPQCGGNCIDMFAVARWSGLDFGAQVVAGLDVQLGRRVFPFLEYRHLFGESTTDDLRVGAASYTAEELRYDDGRDLPSTYDWSGPIVMLGLKIRF